MTDDEVSVIVHMIRVQHSYGNDAQLFAADPDALAKELRQRLPEYVVDLVPIGNDRESVLVRVPGRDSRP